MARPPYRTAVLTLVTLAVSYGAYRWSGRRAPPAAPPRPVHHAVAAERLGPPREILSFPGKARLAGLAVDGAGNLVIAAALSGTIDLGGGPLTSAGEDDVVVAKLDPRGRHLWSRHIGGPGYQVPVGVAVDAEGRVFVAGTLDQRADFGGGELTSAGVIDVFVAAYAPDGAHLWSKRFGDAAEQEVAALAVGASGEVILTGGYEGSIDFGGGPLRSAGEDDVYLAALGPDGRHLWSKRFGDARRQKGKALAVLPGGEIALAGTLEGTMDLGGGPLTAEGEELFLARFGPDGTHRASRRFAGAAATFALPRALLAGPGGALTLAGTVRGAADLGRGLLPPLGEDDAFVLSLSPSGSSVFARRFGGKGALEPRALAPLPGGGFVLVGRFEGTASLGEQTLAEGARGAAFVAALDPAGVAVGARRFAGSARHAATCAAAAPGGAVWVGVDAEGSLDLGRGPVAGPAIHLVKLGP
jgi:hypothetical protein